MTEHSAYNYNNDNRNNQLLEETKGRIIELLTKDKIEIVKRVKELIKILNVNNFITSLDLSHKNIGPEGAAVLAEALKINKSIIKLNIWDNNIGDEGAKALAEALKENKSITIFLVDGSNNIGGKGAKALAEALKVNTSITHLDISDNNIGPEGAKALAAALAVNTSITHLMSNNIGLEGVLALAEALKVNKFITDLKVSDNNIGPEEATALAEALKINKSITCLKLSNIGPEGATVLVEALKINKSITIFNLDGNNIRPEKAEDIAKDISKATQDNRARIEKIIEQLIQSLFKSNNGEMEAEDLKDVKLSKDLRKLITDYEYMDKEYSLKHFNKTLEKLNITNKVATNLYYKMNWLIDTLKSNYFTLELSKPLEALSIEGFEVTPGTYDIFEKILAYIEPSVSKSCNHLLSDGSLDYITNLCKARVQALGETADDGNNNRD